MFDEDYDISMIDYDVEEIESILNDTGLIVPEEVDYTIVPEEIDYTIVPAKVGENKR